MEKLMFGSLEGLRFGLPRFARNDMTSPLPHEGHKFEQTRNEFCETACMRAKRVAEGVGERGLNAAFTLAEVLITLAIIGVVAALTIPTLITKMSERAANARKDTIEARLLDGINRYSALEDGLSQHYETTYDFLVGLSKHYKMAQICKANEITNCIPYDKIYSSVNDDSVDVSTLTSADKFLSGNAINDYLAPASFITAQGTPVIMAFKKDCAWDMGKAMRSIEDSGCIAYMYDESGTRLPNKLGKDWVQHGLTVNGLPVAIVGDYKIMDKAFLPKTGLTLSECETEVSKNYGISSCQDLSTNYGGDRWAAAMKYCHDRGYRVSNQDETIAIINGIFKDGSGNHPSGMSWDSNIYKIDTVLADTIGLINYDYSTVTQSNVDMRLWSSVQYNSEKAYRYAFYTDHATYGGSNKRWGTYGQVLCLGD